MPDHFYTVMQAADVLGLSAPTIRRMIRNGELQTFGTPGGHLRVAAESLDRIRDGRTEGSRNREPSSVLKNRREGLEGQGIEIQELRGQRDLRQLRKEKAEDTERDRQDVLRKEREQLEEKEQPRREVERAQLEENRRRRERQEDAERARDIAEDEKRRDAIVEAAIKEVQYDLPVGAKAYFGLSKWQHKLRSMARSDIAKLGLSATWGAIRDAASAAAQAVGEEYEQSEVRKAAQENQEATLRREARAREAKEEELQANLREGLGHVDSYVSELIKDGELEELSFSEQWALEEKLKRRVRPKLLEELKADVDLDHESEVEEIVETLVDEFLGLEDEEEA